MEVGMYDMRAYATAPIVARVDRKRIGTLRLEAGPSPAAF